MRVLFVLAALLAAPGLSACSTAYGKMGLTGGVDAAPMAADTYRISARGNGYTGATTIQDYAFLKAAETTLAAGKTHFTILSGTDRTDKAYGQTAGTFSTYGGIGWYNPGYTYDIVKPGEDMVIHVWSPGPKDALPPGTYNAQQVFDNISPRVTRAKNG
jgi:hypothetical protein